jgi:hypothetical protein
MLYLKKKKKRDDGANILEDPPRKDEIARRVPPPQFTAEQLLAIEARRRRFAERSKYGSNYPYQGPPPKSQAEPPRPPARPSNAFPPAMVIGRKRMVDSYLAPYISNPILRSRVVNQIVESESMFYGRS